MQNAIEANSYLIEPLVLGNTESGYIDWPIYEKNSNIKIFKGETRMGGQVH